MDAVFTASLSKLGYILVYSDFQHIFFPLVAKLTFPRAKQPPYTFGTMHVGEYFYMRNGIYIAKFSYWELTNKWHLFLHYFVVVV